MYKSKKEIDTIETHKFNSVLRTFHSTLSMVNYPFYNHSLKKIFPPFSMKLFTLLK